MTSQGGVLDGCFKKIIIISKCYWLSYLGTICNNSNMSTGLPLDPEHQMPQQSHVLKGSQSPNTERLFTRAGVTLKPQSFHKHTWSSLTSVTSITLMAASWPVLTCRPWTKRKERLVNTNILDSHPNRMAEVSHTVSLPYACSVTNKRSSNEFK